MPELDSAHLPAPLPMYKSQRTLIDERRIHVFFSRAGSGGGPVGEDTGA